MPIAMSFWAFSSLCCLADFLPGPDFLYVLLDAPCSFEELLVILDERGLRRDEMRLMGV